MKILKRLIKRNIAGDIILVPVGDASLEIKGLITLNETGEFLWDALEKAENESALAAMLAAEYDVDTATAEADTKVFLQKTQYTPVKIPHSVGSFILLFDYT